MSWHELKTWQPVCDRCQTPGPVMTARHRPALPTGWSSFDRRAGSGRTATYASDIFCEECTLKAIREQSG